MSDKLRIGIIGSGGIARGCHIPGYLSIPDQCEIVAICDASDAALDESERQLNDKGVHPKRFSDYHEMLAAGMVDAVSVATPNALHVGPTVDALKAGVHVLCEKPLAMNAEEARAMCRAAEDSGKILQVALQQRFSGPMRFMREFIANGNMGHIYYARAQALRRRGVPAWGVFIDKEKQGGGPLIDIGVHILDMTLTLMGYPKPVSAAGKTWDTLGKNPELFNYWGDYDRTKYTVEDFAVGFIRFEDDSVVVLESSFMANLDADPFQTQLFGTKAGAMVKGGGENPVEIYVEKDRQLFNMTPKNIPNVPSAHTAEVQAFVQAIREGLPSPVPGINGLILNAIFDALYKSSETGKEEPVDVSF